MHLIQNYHCLGQKIFDPTDEEICSGKTRRLRQEVLITSTVLTIMSLIILQHSSQIWAYRPLRTRIVSYLASIPVLATAWGLWWVSSMETTKVGLTDLPRLLKPSYEDRIPSRKALREQKLNQIRKEWNQYVVAAVISGLIGIGILMRVGRLSPHDSLLTLTLRSIALSSAPHFTIVLLWAAQGPVIRYIDQLGQPNIDQLGQPTFDRFPSLPKELQTKIMERAGSEATAFSQTNKGFRGYYVGENSDPGLRLCYCTNYLHSAIEKQAFQLIDMLEPEELVEVDHFEAFGIRALCAFVLDDIRSTTNSDLFDRAHRRICQESPRENGGALLNFWCYYFGRLCRHYFHPRYHSFIERGDVEAYTRDMAENMHLFPLFDGHRPTTKFYASWFAIYHLAWANQSAQLKRILDNTAQGRLSENVRSRLLKELFLPILNQFPAVMTDALEQSLREFERALTSQTANADTGGDNAPHNECAHSIPHLISALLLDAHLEQGTPCAFHETVREIIQNGPYRDKAQFAEADRQLKEILQQDGSLTIRLIVLNAYHKIYKQLNRLPLIYSK